MTKSIDSQWRAARLGSTNRYLQHPHATTSTITGAGNASAVYHHRRASIVSPVAGVGRVLFYEYVLAVLPSMFAIVLIL